MPASHPTPPPSGGVHGPDFAASAECPKRCPAVGHIQRRREPFLVVLDVLGRTPVAAHSHTLWSRSVSRRSRGGKASSSLVRRPFPEDPQTRRISTIPPGFAHTHKAGSAVWWDGGGVQNRLIARRRTATALPQDGLAGRTCPDISPRDIVQRCSRWCLACADPSRRASRRGTWAGALPPVSHPFPLLCPSSGRTALHDPAPRARLPRPTRSCSFRDGLRHATMASAVGCFAYFFSIDAAHNTLV